MIRLEGVEGNLSWIYILIRKIEGAVLATIWSLILRSLPRWYQALDFFKPGTLSSHNARSVRGALGAVRHRAGAGRKRQSSDRKELAAATTRPARSHPGDHMSVSGGSRNGVI